MVLDNRLIGIRLNWEPTIQIVKIAICFSTTCNHKYTVQFLVILHVSTYVAFTAKNKF